MAQGVGLDAGCCVMPGADIINLPPLSNGVEDIAPPLSMEFEQSLLGSLMTHPHFLERVAGVLQPHHFSDGLHGRMYAAMLEMQERGEAPSPLLLSRAFDNEPDLEALGGPRRYIANLAISAVTTANTWDYALGIVDYWMRRQLMDAGRRMIERAGTDFEARAEAIAHEVEGAIEALPRHTSQVSVHHHGDVANDVLADIDLAMKGDAATGIIRTGFYDFDRLIGGLAPGDLLIVAGRPSMGKSAWAGDVGMKLARRRENPVSVGILSLEMSRQQWTARNLAMLTGISTDRQRLGQVSIEEFQRLHAAKQRLDQIPIHIDDRADLTLSQLRDAGRLMVKRKGCRLIIVDYLQLITLDYRSREGNRTQEITEISRGLKQMAKALNVPVVALSQLSRAVETREDKRPQLSDLRESGSIEQDADAVAMLYREQYYLEREEPKKTPKETHERFNQRTQDWESSLAASIGKTDLIVPKARHGKPGVATLIFNGEKQSFENAAGDRWDPR